MKEKALSTIIFLFICFVGFEYAKMYYHEKRERERVTESFKASEQTLTYYRTQNGKIAAQNQTLQLRYNEVKQIYPKVLEEIHNLDIKPKHVTEYSETVVFFFVFLFIALLLEWFCYMISYCLGSYR